MDGRRSMVLLLCAAALAAGIVVVLGVTGTAHASGRAALTDRARAFTKLLEAPEVGADELAPYLAPGVSIRDPRVREALGVLRGAFKDGSLVSEVRTSGGSLGETDVFVMSAIRPGAIAQTLTLSWSKTSDGVWVIDPVAR
jgi:hypothetical protein